MASRSETTPSLIAAQAVYLFSRFPVGVLSFVLLVTLFSVGLGTAIIGVGFLVLALTFMVIRVGAGVERDLLRLVGGPDLGSPYRPDRAGTARRWAGRLGDPATYRDLLYLLLLFPLGLINFVVLTVILSVTAATIAAPFYYRQLGDALTFDTLVVDSVLIDTLSEALILAGVGLLAATLVPSIIRGMAAANFAVAELLLGPSNSGSAERRPQTLQELQDDVIPSPIG